MAPMKAMKAMKAMEPMKATKAMKKAAAAEEAPAMKKMKKSMKAMKAMKVTTKPMKTMKKAIKKAAPVMKEMAVAEFFTCAGVIMEDYRIRCHDMSNVESLRRLQHWVTKICNSLGRWPRAWLSPQELLNVMEERNCRDLNLFVLSNGPLASVVKLLEAQSTQIDQIINQIKVDIPYDKMHVEGSDGVQDEWCNFDIEGYLDGACAGAFGHLQSDETMTMKRQILPHVLLKFFRCGQYYE